MVNTEIRLIIFFVAKDGEALYSQQKQDLELTVAQIMNSLLPNSDLNWRRPFMYDLNPLQLYSGSDKQISGIRSDRRSAWRTINGGLCHCTGGRDQDHPQEKEVQKDKMVVWGGLTNSCEKKRSKRQRRKGKIHPFECRVPKNRKER